MGLRIQNNVEAYNTHRQLSTTSTAAAKAMEKLSSGYRINRAADDAAGLAISEKMRGQIGGLAQAQRNAQDGISLVQTAEGSLSEVHSMLQRVRDLKVQYGNDTLSTDDRAAIAAEVYQIASEIKNITDATTGTQFNGKAVFGTTGFTFQVGANDSETVATTAADFSTSLAAGGLSEITGISSAAAATTALTAGGGMDTLADLDTAIKNVSKVRSEFGAVQNRLEHRLNNLATYQENLTASESRIRDVDMAKEMTNFTKLNILQQAGTSMLAQANQAPQGVLALLRG
jgi:flagellin